METISANRYLDDVALAETLLHNANQNSGKLSNADIVFGLRNLLKMKYYPVAVKYFFTEASLRDFKKRADYKIAFHPYTFCHYVAASLHNDNDNEFVGLPWMRAMPSAQGPKHHADVQQQ
jgi:hypothetical protein